MPVDENVNTRARSYRVTDSTTGAYFDVNFIFAPFIHSREFTAFVDPVGYVERSGLPLPQMFFQVRAPVGLDEWYGLAQGLVDIYLEYRRTGINHLESKGKAPIADKEPESPVVRVSRYHREPVI
jgi:hypothetical protein